MISSLPLFHKINGRRVLVLGDGDAAEPKIRLVERAGGLVERDMKCAIEAGVRLAFIAYQDAEACRTAATNLRRAGMLVNVVDMPELCDFTTPSILDRDPLLVAIGTGGASAGLAKHVRLRMERLLPQTLGKLAVALFNARAKLRARFPDGAERRRALDSALQEGGRLDPFDSDSASSVAQWLDVAENASAGRIEVIQLVSDDPDDLTLRQARLLGIADIIVLSGEIPVTVLARARADAQRLTDDQFIDEQADQTIVRLIAPNHAA